MKYKSQLIGGACVASLALGLPLTTWAAGKKSASPPPEASVSPASSVTAIPSVKPFPFHGVIASVDQTAKTFTITGKTTSRVFKITDQTKIMKEGNPATMSDLAEKAEVRGAYWKSADGSLEAKTVKLGPKKKKDSKKKDATLSPSSSATP